MTNYPESLDSDSSLYLAKNNLRLVLAEDYTPGDTTILVEETLLINLWPDSGIITLTEQCSDVEDRAISFSYDGIEDYKFLNIVLLEEFEDVAKQKKITNVTQNVMAQHHNALKDSVKSIQGFCGIKDTTDLNPFGDTMEGRTNFLRNLVLQPKVWFTVNKRIGIVPFEVEFTDQSFRLGTDGTAGEVELTWDFGDNTSSQISLISVTTDVPTDAINVLVYDEDRGTVKKTYITPGMYDVILTARNDFGTSSCRFENLINARIQAPNEAVIQFVGQPNSQIVTDGDPVNGPFDVVPKIRSPINTLINVEVGDGENNATPGYSFSGEFLSNGSPVDPVNTYTWSFGDDLEHPNARTTKASYSIGGVYDLKLRVDTDFGAYRITTYEDAVDVVEDVNLWVWIYNSTNTVKAYEYGLISQTFKLTTGDTLTVGRNDSFLDGFDQQQREFNRNVGLNPVGTQQSGRKGIALLYWASGRDDSDSPTTEEIKFSEFNGFEGTYTTRASIDRPWNWASFNAPASTYFILGQINTSYPVASSPTNLNKQSVQNVSHTLIETEMVIDDFSNATELMENISEFDDVGESVYGNFSVYRTSWKDSTGYLTRNDGIGPYFRIKSFYKTTGTVGDPFLGMKKLQDIQGTPKYEGDIVTLTDGIYFFNNSGAISAYNDTSGIWQVTGPGLNSAGFRSLQDSSVEEFDNTANTLRVASDGDRRAYLSYDYSSNAFIKFDQIDKTFSTLGSRPEGTQFLMGIY